MPRKLTLEIVKKRLEVINPSIEILSESYINSRSSLKCRCKIDGNVWYSRWSNLQQKNGCPECSVKSRTLSIDKIKEELKKINSSIYIKEEDYINSKTKMRCVCLKCSHEWYTIWNSLKQGKGCPECGKYKNTRLLDLDNIMIKLAHILPNVKILDSKYLGTNSKLRCCCTRCKQVFFAPWGTLKQGHGCPECANNNKGWTRSKWLGQAKDSRHFDSFKFYIIICTDKETGESFFKAGRTFLTIEQRYGSKKKMPYDYEIIKVIKSENGAYIYDLENFILSYYKNINLQVLPQKKFKGSKRECFSQLPDLEEVLKQYG